jgi:hypothetical protein
VARAAPQSTADMFALVRFNEEAHVIGPRVRLTLVAAAAVAGAMVAAVPAFADATKVSGSGSSPDMESLVLSARGDQNGADGFVRVRGSFFGDLGGQVTCIASLPELPAVTVGGMLDSPVSLGGSTWPFFYVRIAGEKSPTTREFASVTVSTIPLPDCGLPLLFEAGWPSEGALVTRGNFTIH